MFNGNFEETIEKYKNKYSKELEKKGKSIEIVEDCIIREVSTNEEYEVLGENDVFCTFECICYSEEE